MTPKMRLLTGIFLTFLAFHTTHSATSKLDCSKTIRDSPSVSSGSLYYEAVLGSDFLLNCHVCRHRHHSVTVTWAKDSVEIKQSSRVHSVHSEQSEVFSLRIRALGPGDLGNYTCSLALDNTAGAVKTDVVDSTSMVLGLLPPPPVFVELRDRVNQTSQLLTWTGESQMAIIHFLMEFRLRPLAGSGEDWVSLVIPYNSAVSTQSYLLRGLTPETSYEARLRSKTRHGVSHFSSTWVFSTWAPWTTPRPVTVFLPQTQEETRGIIKEQDPWGDSFSSFTHNSQHTSLAKELSTFSSGLTTRASLGFVISCLLTMF